MMFSFWKSKEEKEDEKIPHEIVLTERSDQTFRARLLLSAYNGIGCVIMYDKGPQQGEYVTVKDAVDNQKQIRDLMWSLFKDWLDG